MALINDDMAEVVLGIAMRKTPQPRQCQRQVFVGGDEDTRFFCTGRDGAAFDPTHSVMRQPLGCVAHRDHKQIAHAGVVQRQQSVSGDERQ